MALGWGSLCYHFPAFSAGAFLTHQPRSSEDFLVHNFPVVWDQMSVLTVQIRLIDLQLVFSIAASLLISPGSRSLH